MATRTPVLSRTRQPSVLDVAVLLVLALSAFSALLAGLAGSAEPRGLMLLGVGVGLVCVVVHAWRSPFGDPAVRFAALAVVTVTLAGAWVGPLAVLTGCQGVAWFRAGAPGRPQG